MNNSQVPLISVLMTAFNRERYIGDAIKSVLASSYTHLELIIVDDGSTDNTVNIANSFAASDARVYVYTNPQNLGDYPNRNKAAAYAKGKYLKYVDADDLIYPWGLQLLVQMMESFPEAGWGLCSLDQDGTNIFPFQLTAAAAYRYHYTGPGLFHKAPLSSIIKKEVFEKVGGFEPIRMAGDFAMWNRLAQDFPVVLLPQGLVWYRKHEAQEMSSYEKFLAVYDAVQIKYLQATNCPLPVAEAHNILKQSARKILISSIKQLLKLHLLKSSSTYYRYRTFKKQLNPIK
jgi:glycosyltransferase involved in cell wall biosynthesis